MLKKERWQEERSANTPILPTLKVSLSFFLSIFIESHFLIFSIVKKKKKMDLIEQIRNGGKERRR